MRHFNMLCCLTPPHATIHHSIPRHGRPEPLCCDSTFLMTLPGLVTVTVSPPIGGRLGFRLTYHHGHCCGLPSQPKPHLEGELHSLIPLPTTTREMLPAHDWWLVAVGSMSELKSPPHRPFNFSGCDRARWVGQAWSVTSPVY